MNHWSKQFQKKLGFCFLLNPSKEGMGNLELALRTSNLKHPVFIDTTGVFMRKNSHIPKEQMLHTFLLDENNKVILVGDPVRNKRIYELFRKKVVEKLGKKNSMHVILYLENTLLSIKLYLLLQK